MTKRGRFAPSSFACFLKKSVLYYSAAGKLRHRTPLGDDSHKAEFLPDEKNNNSLDP